MCAEQLTSDDRAVLNDLLGGIDPYRVECSGFTPLVERPLSLLAESADETAHFINLAVLPAEEAADLLASAEAPRVFLDPGIRRDQ